MCMCTDFFSIKAVMHLSSSVADGDGGSSNEEIPGKHVLVPVQKAFVRVQHLPRM